MKPSIDQLNQSVRYSGPVGSFSALVRALYLSVYVCVLFPLVVDS